MFESRFFAQQKMVEFRSSLQTTGIPHPFAETATAGTPASSSHIVD
jgi:hypothetical protein